MQMILILSFSAVFRVVPEPLESSLCTEIVYACHDTTVLDTPGLSMPEDMDDSDRKFVIKLLLLPTLYTLSYLPPVEVVSFVVTGNAYI